MDHNACWSHNNPRPLSTALDYTSAPEVLDLCLSTHTCQILRFSWYGDTFGFLLPSKQSTALTLSFIFFFLFSSSLSSPFYLHFSFTCPLYLAHLLQLTSRLLFSSFCFVRTFRLASCFTNMWLKFVSSSTTALLLLTKILIIFNYFLFCVCTNKSFLLSLARHFATVCSFHCHSFFCVYIPIFIFIFILYSYHDFWPLSIQMPNKPEVAVNSISQSFVRFLKHFLPLFSVDWPLTLFCCFRMTRPDSLPGQLSTSGLFHVHSYAFLPFSSRSRRKHVHLLLTII